MKNPLTYTAVMYHSIHTDFIQTPIQAILLEGLNACNAIGAGMETQPLCEYIFSSIFLRMTGAQEQKLKCIHWELATNDYETRRSILDRSQKDLGEYSNYKDKNQVYKTLVKLIEKNSGEYTVFDDKKDFISDVMSVMEAAVRKTCLHLWSERDFLHFQDRIKDRFDLKQIPFSKDHFFESVLRDDYEQVVYRHRNRCAHNLTSYQRHLPKLEDLASEKYQWHNYFYRFAILILIDRIFIRLHQAYVASLY